MSLLTPAQPGWAAQGTAPPSSTQMNLAQAAPGGGLDLSGADYAVVGVVMVIALAALAFGYVLIKEVLAAGQGSAKMQEISRAVQEGAAAYLNRQFRTLAGFAVVVFLVLFALPADSAAERIGRSIFFLFGAAFSAAIGYLGMWLSTRANVRVAAASNDPGAGRQTAMKVAFRTGGVVGMTTVGLGLFGASLVVLVYAGEAPRVLEGFGFGAALLAMFMRVGGGIFTKAADVGADLVGKVEQDIPEDDPRNAATIADNVGDNVGDCAGMAADLFESYAVTLVASLILGTAAFGLKGLLFPLIVPAIGVVTAVIGVYITRARAAESALTAINRSFYISAGISAVACAIAALLYLPTSFSQLAGVSPEISNSPGNPALIALAAVIIGILLAVVILKLTGYFTATEHRPVLGGGEVAGQLQDHHGQQNADDHRGERDQRRVARAVADLRGDPGQLRERRRQVQQRGDRARDRGDARRDVERAVDRGQRALGGPRPGDVDADDRGDHADRGHDQREQQTLQAERRGAQDQRGHQRDRVGLEQVRRHARAVADVVAHVVRDGRGVAGVVLRDVLLDLADQVGTHVGGLGEDAAADPHEHRQQGGAEAEALQHPRCFTGVDQHHQGRAEQAQADRGHADHTAGAERHLHRRLPARTRVVRGRRDPHVRAGGQPHPEVTDGRRERGTEQEEDRSADPLGGAVGG